MIEHIRRIHQMSRKTYGSPRVHAQLWREGRWVNHKRVARLMRQEGLVGRRKYRKMVTTNSKHPYPIAPNLLNQEFEAEKPNQKWVADITYIPTAEGWLYLAVVLDLFSRKIVGWEMSSELTADLVEKALADGTLPTSTRAGSAPSFGSWQPVCQPPNPGHLESQSHPGQHEPQRQLL